MFKISKLFKRKEIYVIRDNKGNIVVKNRPEGILPTLTAFDTDVVVSDFLAEPSAK